jgi:hypothetical protein
MLHSERVITAQQGAHMVGLTLSSFRTKVSRLGVKGKKDGRNVFYTLGEIVRVKKGIKARGKSVVSFSCCLFFWTQMLPYKKSDFGEPSLVCSFNCSRVWLSIAAFSKIGRASSR